MKKKKKSLGNYCRRQRNYTVWKNSRYELNVLTPENDVFFEKSEFYSDLKQKALRDSDYESSLFLYKTLKMRNLCDMNDLYNAQDVILLCEIAENRFQFMHDQYGFNPRKCNSASTQSDCIEREMSRVITSLQPLMKQLISLNK